MKKNKISGLFILKRKAAKNDKIKGGLSVMGGPYPHAVWHVYRGQCEASKKYDFVNFLKIEQTL